MLLKRSKFWSSINNDSIQRTHNLHRFHIPFLSIPSYIKIILTYCRGGCKVLFRLTKSLSRTHKRFPQKAIREMAWARYFHRGQSMHKGSNSTTYIHDHQRDNPKIVGNRAAIYEKNKRTENT